MTTIIGQVPGVGTSNERTVKGACNTLTATHTHSNTEIVPSAEKIGESLEQSVKCGELSALIGGAT
jgi:hypothetical protein